MVKDTEKRPKVKPDRDSRNKLIEEIQESAKAKVTPGPEAARSQDFLYGEDGLPI